MDNGKIRCALMAGALMAATGVAACTNFIVGRGASADGSVMCTYSADDYGMFQELEHYPAARHADGTMRTITDWDTHVRHGEIPEAAVTYNVVGNINEWQVTIGETTFGGREEMADTTGLVDYGSLMHIALQRSRSAREAIGVMTSIAEQYGYCSEGETFTVCDASEAWIMEMMGCGVGSKSVVWVALRIPDNAICGHANQSRIRTFDRTDTANVRCSDNVVAFARSKGWYTGADEDFSFCETYAAPDFVGRRCCEARVWSFFNRFADGMNRYLPYVTGRETDTEPLPLWIVPERKVSLADMEAAMRDHYEGTPFALDSDIGGGIWEMPYRPTPLTFEHDSVTYFNERPTSTQQSGFVYVSQMRSWLPREIGGVLWFANDDSNMAPFTPVYCSATTVPTCYKTPGVDAVTFSTDNAYWVCNWVSNMVYPRYSLMFPTLMAVRDSLDDSYMENQSGVEEHARKLYDSDRDAVVAFLTHYGEEKASQMLSRWRQLAVFLIVKYNDMIIKPDTDGVFTRTDTGLGAKVVRPGYGARFVNTYLNLTGDKFRVPEEEKKEGQ